VPDTPGAVDVVAALRAENAELTAENALRPANTCMVIGPNVLTYKELGVGHDQVPQDH
jgi:hypothetical protein